MTQQLQQFAEAASHFCRWAEASPSAPDDEAFVALQHLSNLYLLALKLPSAPFGQERPSEITLEAWTQIKARFGALPFNYYSQCLNPHDLEAGETGIADLADDLADIWRDLKRGLSLFSAGHTAAACWEWRQGFWQHWGDHAAGGIYALHNWASEHPQSAT